MKLPPPRRVLSFGFLPALFFVLFFFHGGGLKLSPQKSYAATPELIGTFKKWQAFVYGQGKSKVCYITSDPLKSSPKNVKRGNVFITVTHRPKLSIRNEISLRIGYVFSKKSKPYVQINKKRFQFLTHIEGKSERSHWAWLFDSKSEKRMIQSMKKGSTLIFKGTSARGTLTTDHYSLQGFTKAIQAIDKAC